MPQQTYSVSENVWIQIRNCHNRVTVIGWEDTQHVSVDYAARQESDAIIIENADRVMVRVPRRAGVSIADCEADVRVEDLDGRVELEHIGGDVSLRDLRGETLARDVDGDLTARAVASLKGEDSWDGDFNAFHVRGALALNEVKGDVNLREVSGRVSLDRVEGDFIASGVKNALQVLDVEGDAVVSFAEMAPMDLRADGDVVINLPEHGNAEIELDAPHGDLIAHAEIKVAEEDESHLSGLLGSGGTKIRAESTHGDLILRAGGAERHYVHAAVRGEEFADMGQRIAQQVRESMRESFKGWRVKTHPKIKIKKHWGRMHHVHDEKAREEEKPRGPAAGSVERQAILDAIARGELNVDDAIKKLRGEG